MSAYMKPNYLAPTPIAAVAITKGKAVKLDGSGEVVLCGAGASSIGDMATGFADADYAVGQPVSIAVFGGGARAIAAGTIAAGAQLKTNADGDLVATTTTGDIIAAIADEAGVDNDVISVRPTPPYKY